MKQEFDREMDSLLRGAVGGARGARSRPGAGAGAAHLSADELSAYAENALPPAARSRYTAHVVDCDDCRRIVAGIALAAGPEVVRAEQTSLLSEVQTVVAPPRRSWFDALFSQRVLRFALPVLAVAIVGVLGLVVMENRGRKDESRQVAQQQSPAEAQNKTSIAQAPHTSPSNAPAAQEANASPAMTNASEQPEAGKLASVGRAAGTAGTTAPKEFDALSAPPPAKSAAPAEAEPSAELAAAEKKEMKAADTQQPVINMAPPSPAAVAAQRAGQREATAGGQKADGREQQRQVAESERLEDDAAPARRRRNEETRSGPSRDMNRMPAGKSKSRADDEAGSGEFAVKPGAAGSSASPEKRSVAGHEFRRRDGQWVDVRYRESMATASYRRGSEGFRALVADVPEIGRVAEQLPGTVIVVARGRAYRIH